LALFAGTVGEDLSIEIQRLFDIGDLASAVMLDAAASEGAERFVTILEQIFEGRNDELPRQAVLAYSPGYCGWHVSGQRRLFHRLRPTECGITLNSSFLMSPLKSVSGVLVAGRPEIHDFEDEFDCCAACVTRECRGRIERALEV
jgi:cobalamin-dependent methionine synthase I